MKYTLILFTIFQFASFSSRLTADPQPDAKASGDRGAGTSTIVTVSKSSPELPRRSEGDVIELTDGGLLLVSMEFGGDGSDFATTRFVSHESSDGGER